MDGYGCGLVPWYGKGLDNGEGFNGLTCKELYLHRYCYTLQKVHSLRGKRKIQQDG